MTDSERQAGHLEMLVHAQDDMIEATVAAEHLAKALEEGANRYLTQALFTGMTVAYCRPFTGHNPFKLGRADYEPTDDPTVAALHRDLFKWRNEVYAHTDVNGGRHASQSVDAQGIRFTEWQRRDLPRAKIPTALTLFALQRKRFEADADRRPA